MECVRVVCGVCEGCIWSVSFNVLPHKEASTEILDHFQLLASSCYIIRNSNRSEHQGYPRTLLFTATPSGRKAALDTGT